MQKRTAATTKGFKHQPNVVPIEGTPAFIVEAMTGHQILAS